MPVHFPGTGQVPLGIAPNPWLLPGTAAWSLISSHVHLCIHVHMKWAFDQNPSIFQVNSDPQMDVYLQLRVSELLSQWLNSTKTRLFHTWVTLCERCAAIQLLSDSSRCDSSERVKRKEPKPRTRLTKKWQRLVSDTFYPNTRERGAEVKARVWERCESLLSKHVWTMTANIKSVSRPSGWRMGKRWQFNRDRVMQRRWTKTETAAGFNHNWSD